MQENQNYDRKSLRSVQGRGADYSELAKDCVAFSNSFGGVIHVGIEDRESLPPKDQRIGERLPVQVQKRLSELTVNVGLTVTRMKAENGGEYLEIRIASSGATIAATSDGRYFIRIGDSSRPLMPDEMIRAFTDKPSFVWETVKSPFRADACDGEKLSLFQKWIQASDRVSDFVKGKSVNSLMEHYFLSTDDGFLTNLGVLWIGTPYQRASICYAPSVQVIKRDGRGEKIQKLLFDDHTMNPKEMLEAIVAQVSDFREFTEIHDGLYRNRVMAYDGIVIRELIVNALAHRPYTMRGDVFIELSPEGMKITNPGSLPMGISPANIFNRSRQRNERLSRILYDLKLMEKEGSGYHIIYERMLASGKPLPQVSEGRDSVSVFISRNMISEKLGIFMGKTLEAHSLTQRETILLGLLASVGVNTSTMKAWDRELGLLEEKGIIVSEGGKLSIANLNETGNDESPSTGQAEGRTASQFSGQTEDGFSGQTVGQTVGQTAGQTAGQTVGQSVGQTSIQFSGQTEDEFSGHSAVILDIIESNPLINRRELSEAVGLAPSTVQRHLESMKQEGLIVRVGGDFGGHWEVHRMCNLNNNKNVPPYDQDIAERILVSMESNPQITRNELSESLGMAPSTIQRYIYALKSLKQIVRIGGAFGGHWQVIRRK